MSRKHSCVFFVGAGISVSSNLPTGCEFALQIFDMLVRGATRLRGKTLATLRDFAARELRLEMFLQILTEEIPPDIVLAPFALLLSARPCINHFAITTVTSQPIVTTNQDLLLEKAAATVGREYEVEVVHLHGRADDVSTIRAVVGDYLPGLPRKIARDFEHTITRNEIIVLGYSGRDHDVMQALLKARPRSVTWILHPGSAIYPELEAAQETFGEDFRIISCDTTAWLREQLQPKQRLRLEREAMQSALVAPEMPVAVRTAFEGIPLARRQMAIARLLTHLGEYDNARPIYERLHFKNRREEAQRLLSLANTLRRLKKRKLGLALLTSLRNDDRAPSDIRATAVLTLADELRNRSRYQDAEQELASLNKMIAVSGRSWKPSTYGKLRGAARAEKAGMDRLDGRLKRAASAYESALLSFRKSGDVDGEVDTLTWAAETSLMLGDFDEGRRRIDEALRRAAPYAKKLVAAWPLYVKAEYLCIIGYFAEALSSLKQASEMFASKGNTLGSLWSLLLEADCLRERDTRAAEQKLAELSPKIKGHKAIQARYYLLKSDLARQHADWQDVSRCLSAIRNLYDNEPENIGKLLPPMLRAHVLLVRAECAHAQHKDEATALLKRAREAYLRVGATAFVARVDVAAMLARGPGVKRERLLRNCRLKGYLLEFERLTMKSSGFYPIHFM